MTRGPLAGPPGTKPALTATDPRKVRQADRLFKSVAAAAGSTIVVAVLLIAIFLLVRAVPSLRANRANFFTSAVFDTVDANHLAFGVSDLFMVTVLSSMCALVLAVPIAVGIAVFLTQYAPARLSRPFAGIVDLLAAVPSIIFGLWGIFVLAPRLELWIPCFIGSVKAGPPSSDAVSEQLQLRSRNALGSAVAGAAIPLSRRLRWSGTPGPTIRRSVRATKPRGRCGLNIVPSVI